MQKPEIIDKIRLDLKGLYLLIIETYSTRVGLFARH